jgi:hypothetical protein
MCASGAGSPAAEAPSPAADAARAASKRAAPATSASRKKRARKGGSGDATAGPLGGVLFSVSVDAERDGGAANGAADGGAAAGAADAEGHASSANGFSFAEVTARCAALGGKYSATVHKKVAVLLATPGAVERRTQRVRKAAKLGVAIVDAASYLRACDRGRRPDAADHALRPADGAALAVEPPAACPKAVDINSDAYWAGAVTYDGGCSCACHDEGKASCEWCAHLHS